ncbi:hypothetical protein METSCH_A09730 [Metschnikowia aff. pulcherrima]|uniref:Uncharacterized protein n=1 Tax=Metschnikowia aff. pulcherrima TaxID=2163413 RepID=A0A4P6XJQ0_9ASCO|nr:hypothetical protein METSCH_A09730 [Metschnikowia aff. pulcherrima]
MYTFVPLCRVNENTFRVITMHFILANIQFHNSSKNRPNKVRLRTPRHIWATTFFLARRIFFLKVSLALALRVCMHSQQPFLSTHNADPPHSQTGTALHIPRDCKNGPRSSLLILGRLGEKRNKETKPSSIKYVHFSMLRIICQPYFQWKNRLLEKKNCFLDMQLA